MYKQVKDLITGSIANVIVRISDGASIPFDPANTDYQAFKQDIAEGKPLQDADGNEMTAEAAQEYLASLP